MLQITLLIKVFFLFSSCIANSVQGCWHGTETVQVTPLRRTLASSP